MEIECTQRLECTQELYNTQTERTDPEQIGFLGICGTKHPVKKGPNKIGRDPQTCYINLNLNSVSRQHAVINVLSMSEIMLMDLDSANKTKVQGKTLQPYIPHPLRDGDTVQFGAIFGIFRLLEDDTDLPMTQAIDLPMTQVIEPCTPAPSKQMSRLGPPVLVPESPEVSDMDDSFVMPSQPKKSSEFKSPMNKFLKPSNKTIAIQPMGSKTIDNAYWASARKSDSFNFQLDDSGSTLNDSTVSNKSNKVIEESNDNIYEMETQQVPNKANDSTDSIYSANTQLPPSPSVHCMETQQVVADIHVQDTQQVADIHALDTQNVSDNIHNCNTQVPTISAPGIHAMDTQIVSDAIHNCDTQAPAIPVPGIHNLDTQNVSDTIHNCETQVPTIEKLPDVCKINEQEDMQLDLFTANKENDNSIFNAETQAFVAEKKPASVELKKSIPVKPHETSKENHESDEEIVFDEFNTQSFQEDDCESQALIPPGNISPPIERIEKNEVSLNRSRKESGSSTDCEDIDILPNQKLSTNIDSLPMPMIATDVHMLATQKIINDNDVEMLPTQKIVKENDDDDDLTDCEDELPSNELKESKGSPEIDFEDMATQIIGDDVIEAEINKTKDETDGPSNGTTSFEELPTQLITDDSKEDNLEDMPTQILIDDDQNKVQNEVYSEEIVSPFKIPFPTPLKVKKIAKLTVTNAAPKEAATKVDDDDPNYYPATQDILNDLCTQREPSPETDKAKSGPKEKLDDDELVPCSVEGYKMGDPFRHIESDLSPVIMTNSIKVKDKSEPNKNTGSTGKLTKEKSISSDANIVLKTPKTLKIINVDLPDSQEIKTSVTLKHKSVTESSSDTETDDVSDQDSGIVYGKKRKPKVNAKQDLTKKFEELPSRIITRVRKPTLKIRESDETTKSQCRSILKSTILPDSEDSIDAEIVNENISRLKSKTDKKKEKDGDHSKRLSDETKKRPHSRNENKKTDKSIEKSEKDTKGRSSRSKSKKTDEPKSKTESPVDSKDKVVRSTRSSRNKKDDKKDDKSKKDEKKRDSKEKDRSHSKSRSDSKTRHESKYESKTRSASKESKSRDTKSKDKDSKRDKTVSPEMTRRSSRQKKDKEVTPKHDNSTVYLSSESSLESPKNLKRSAPNELEVPSPKRTRSLPSSKTSMTSSSVSTSVNTSVCSTPVRVQTQYVLFTAFSNDDVKSKLENLGAVLVTDVMQCTVLVTLQIKRTFKLLCAVGLGRPIVGPDWVQACADTNTIVDPWLYIIKDMQAEKRFNFSLEKTLRGRRNFLEGYHVSSTPSVLPNAQEMKLIVECSGGSWNSAGSPPAWVCVTSSADKVLWGPLRRRGATLVSTEFILGGVLRQQADVKSTTFGRHFTSMVSRGLDSCCQKMLIPASQKIK